MAGLLQSWVVPATLSLIPAAYRLWRGRRMAAFAADAALPERLAGTRNLLIAVFSATLILLVLLWPRHRPWSVPVLLLTFLAAGWPLRRVLFDETWSLGAYMWFYLRLILVVYGFWLLLMAAPWLTTAAGAALWPVAVVGLVLLTWNHQYSTIMRAVLAAKPVAARGLTERFAAIVARASIPPPQIHYVDMRGGVLVNALALPDTERPGVLFSSSLIDRLDESEVAAIFAHEVAHLEYFNRAYLARLRWAGWGIIGAAVLCGPLVLTYAPDSTWLLWLWPAVAFGYMAILTQKRQQHETDSDRRAVSLSGDPEALIRGLVKLHALAKLPRRLDPNLEVNASHPSLARRVRDIREAGQLTAATLDAPVTLTSGTTAVTLHPDRLEWREGDASTHSLAYGSLADLRIEADNRNVTRIVASDPHGRQWSMPLAADDVARAQAALDVIDARVRAKTGMSALRQTVSTLVALLVMVSAVGANQVAAWVVAGLAVFAFERPMTRATGIAGLVAAALALRTSPQIQFPLILLLSSGLLLFLGARDTRDVFSPRTWRFVNVAGVLALLMSIPMWLSASSLLALHQAARQFPSAAVYALAFAAANAMRGGRQRVLTVAALVAGVAAVILGETRTLDRFLADPFLQEPPRREAVAIQGAPLSSFTLDFMPAEVLLSPDGGAIAASYEDEHDSLEFRVGRPGAPLTAVTADDAFFVDDRRLLLARSEEDKTTLSLVDVDRPSSPVWQHTLANSFTALSVDRGLSRWQLLALEADDALVALSGPLDGGPVEKRGWRTPPGGRVRPLAVAGSRVLVQEYAYIRPAGLELLRDWWPRFRGRVQMRTAFAIVDGTTRTPLFESTLFVSCEPGRYSDEGPVCTAHDGTRTHVARINAADGSLVPIAQFDGFTSVSLVPRWITGWNDGPFALDLDGSAIVTVEGRGRRRGPMATAIGAANNLVAVVTSEDGSSSTLSFYRAPAAASATR